jgi:hypothetical protein
MHEGGEEAAGSTRERGRRADVRHEDMRDGENVVVGEVSVWK